MSDKPISRSGDDRIGEHAPDVEAIECLKDFVRELLPRQRPTLERIAPRLGMSVRTLQRRLKDWGYSFAQVLDEVRRETAIERIIGGLDNMTETAFQLGYSDLSHFTRAFRRWTGTTPTEFARSVRRARREGSALPQKLRDATGKEE
jgi:AraC-like DNA-binding protein